MVQRPGRPNRPARAPEPKTRAPESDYDGRTVLHVHQTDSMADMHLWVKGFAHYIAFGGSRVAKTTFSTFIILAHEGPNGEQLKF